MEDRFEKSTQEPIIEQNGDQIVDVPVPQFVPEIIEVLAPHVAATEYVAPTRAVAFDEPAPVTEHLAPAPAVPFDEPAPVIEYVAPAVTNAALSPVTDVAPTPASTYTAPSPVTDYVAPAPAFTSSTPAPVIEYVVLAPAVTYATPSPVIDYVAPVEYVAAAPVSEHIASPPGVTWFALCQQLPSDYSTTAVATGVSLDTTGFVNPPYPTAVEASASHVVGSLPPLDEFTAPVYQEQFVAEQERVQLHTAEQVVHVPAPRIQEQSPEGVDQVLENIVNTIPNIHVGAFEGHQQLAEAIKFPLSLSVSKSSPFLIKPGIVATRGYRTKPR